MSPDAELLLRYANERDERAFAELVQRHLGLVYAAAQRRTGQAQLAEEIAQTVFAELARQAGRLSGHPALAAWLYRSTRYAAIDALRSEHRRQQMIHRAATLPELSTGGEVSPEWEQMRPVLDAAMDQLKERDREVLVLRFFSGCTFAEIGARMGLKENAARMRVERALDQLRGHLGRRGVTSTTAALGLIMVNPALAAAPAGMAATVAAAALATAPAGGLAVAAAIVFMSKLTVPAVSAAFAAGVTALIWMSIVPAGGAKELAALRAENARLKTATAAGAAAESVAAVADEFAAQARMVAGAVGRRLGERRAAAAPSGRAAGDAATADPGRHRNRGQATAHDAYMSFAWAADAGQIAELAKLICFEEQDRPKALAVLASMPGEIRAEYPTPEALYAFFFAADALVAPPPGPDVIEGNQAEELRPGRIVIRRPGRPAQKYDHQFQQTPAGWKYVIPDVGVENAPNILNNETLQKLGQPSSPGHP